MASGRFISKQVGRDKRVRALPPEQRFYFVVAVTHSDRDGRIDGDPEQFMLDCPCLFGDGLDEDDVAAMFKSWEDRGLCRRYTDERGQKVLWFPQFSKHQKGLRYDREAPSKFGNPDSTLSDIPPTSGSAPAVIPERSGVGPDDSGAVPDVDDTREEKRSEGKRSEVKRARARAAPTLRSIRRDPTGMGIEDGELGELAAALIAAHTAAGGQGYTVGGYTSRPKLSEALGQLEQISEQTGEPVSELLPIAARGFFAYHAAKATKPTRSPNAAWFGDEGRMAEYLDAGRSASGGEYAALKRRMGELAEKRKRAGGEEAAALDRELDALADRCRKLREQGAAA